MAKYAGIERGRNIRIANIEAALDGKMSLTGDEVSYGTKTFATSPVVPEKDTAVDNNPRTIATEAQVYEGAYSPLSSLLSLTGDEKVDGIKTFTISPLVPDKDTVVSGSTNANSKAIATEAQVYNTIMCW